MMINRTLAATAIAALLMTPAAAQTSSTTTSPAPAATTGAAGFTQMQKQNQWMGSDLIGAKVVNNANESIGEINDLLVDENGMVQAAVIGVGGFLGIGEKDVAVPFKELKVTRQSDGDIDKVSANFNKDQLKQAPEFKTVEDQRSNQKSTTGSTAPANRNAPNTNK
jgi:hypothetical protein